VLRWQRTCLLSLLSLTQLHLQFPSSESAVGVAELLSIATAWMQDSIKAVCGQRQQPSDNSSSRLTGVYVEVSAFEQRPQGGDLPACAAQLLACVCRQSGGEQAQH
jgi:hypothetical protein